jgi:putative transcriptional regulator
MKMKNDIVFKSKLYEVRKSMNLTQVELAEKVGVDVQVISRMERNSKNPNLVCAVRLAEYFGITVDELFDGFKNSKDSG